MHAITISLFRIISFTNGDKMAQLCVGFYGRCLRMPQGKTTSVLYIALDLFITDTFVDLVKLACMLEYF